MRHSTRSNRHSLGGLVLIGSLLLLSCATDRNRPPELLSLPDYQLNVNQNFQLEVTAYDQDNDLIEFDFSLSPPPPTPTATSGGIPTIQKVSDYRAVFNWTPGNADVGQYNLTLIVRDIEGAETSETISLTVGEGHSTSGQWLSFIEPVGEATVIDLSTTSCFETAVRVQADALSDAEISVALTPPSPSSAFLTPSGPKSYQLSWCPQPEELSSQANFPFVLRATTTRGLPPVDKSYLVRTRSTTSQDCPGVPPSVTHMPPLDYVGVENIQLSIEVMDDIGVKSAPTVTYQVAPRDAQVPPTEFWETLIMTVDPRGTSSRWTASILPPVDPAGNVIFYRFLVSDDDDPNGIQCDHNFESQLYRISYLWDPSLASVGSLPCTPCIDDIQCGSPQDLCLSLDGARGGVCARACDTTVSCPDQFTCSMSGQCISDNACGATCAADIYESPIPGELGNNTQAGGTAISPGRYEQLSICSGDEDHYLVDVQAGQTLTARIEFTATQGDLDIELRDQRSPPQFPALRSNSTEDNFEEVSLRCSPVPATVVVHVSGFEGAQNNYELNITLSDQPCGTECIPDAYEADGGNNSIFFATPAFLNTTYQGTVCPRDVDYFSIILSQDERIEARLELNSADGDLALDLLNENQTILESADGLGRNTEILEFVAPTSGTYYLAVLSPPANANTPYELTIRGGSSQCSGTIQCDLDQYCDGLGRCVPNQCDASCEAGHSCVSPIAGRNPTNSNGTCVAMCERDTDCRAGERCKAFENFIKSCAPAGSQALGQTCSSFSDCQADMICLSSAGGYCAAAGCFSNNDCSVDTLCESLDGTLGCLKRCEQDIDCGRADLSCRQFSQGRACAP